MRISQYKIILKLLDSVTEAVDHMVKINSKILIENCSDVLKNIFEIISHDIDNTHDNMFQSTDNIFDDDSIELDKLHMMWSDTKEKLLDSLKYKYKVLFVAELGGKWDAMDSVYKAFSERDDCDVDVVLEPVFREVQQEDGTIKKEIVYKDYLSEMGIKHILFNNYDMNKERPDITFISQPYESCTLPMFWPENIVKYSRLVYLPYFTATTFNEISTVFNSYFRLNTQKYSWRIPCQTELMKSYFKKYASNRGRNTVVTGLPKWDFPMNFTTDTYPMPEEWKEKIKGKKVFLWNTHFSTQISGSHILTDEVWDFLDIFSQNKNIALIWRPHPMLESVIKIYYGQKEINQYERIISFIESSSNMIIDKYEIYAYSFLYSDALISDFSTLIEQYLFIKKPVILLAEKSVEEEREKFNLNDGLFDYTKILFSDRIDTIKKFICDVCDNNENAWKDQINLISTYFPLADGKVGYRLADVLINDLYKEIFEDDAKTETDFLIVGSLEDSLPCIKQLTENTDDFYICDMFLDPSDREKIENSIFELDTISKFQYKGIIITREGNNDFLKKILIDEYNIDNDLIIDFWKIYNACIPNMVCDRIMKNPMNSTYDGLIIGLSRSEVGIIPEIMKGTWCNLSVSSQDLFYQLQTLKHCFSEYPEKFTDLKYAIVELYDYDYFNYDTSLSVSALWYWSWGGYNKDPHNFSKNSNYKYCFDEIINGNINNKLNGITDHHAEIWNTYLSNVFKYTDYKGFEGNFDIKKRLKIVSDNDIDNYNYQRSSVSKIHDETIDENIDNFEYILELLLSVNPNIKIYTVILPRYKKVEDRDTHLIPLHKRYFDDILVEMKKHYNFIHVDLKDYFEISEDRNSFFDAEHLNMYGAYKMTKVLEDIINNNGNALIFENEK